MATNRSDEYERKKRSILEEFSKNLSSQERASFSLDKKTSNLFRHRKGEASKKLDVKQFNQVIEIDPFRKVAEVEGMITYEDLVRETLRFDLLPPVVPELKTITIGGALAGLGIESSSFRYGLVHETIFEIEVLTGDGRVLVCTPDNEHKDLFYAFPNSYGTLGYALKIKLNLIPAKKYVRLENIRFHEASSFFQQLEKLCREKRSSKTDSYIDAVIFSPQEMYIILGEFVDEAPYLSDYTYLQSYYQSIRKKQTNYLTASDYIWRWDPDWFWCSKHFGMQHRLLRFLFGKFLLRSSVYWKISRQMASNPLLKRISRIFEKPSESVIQDILIPIQHAEEFYTFFQKEIQITPIWICPFHFHKSENRYSLFDVDPHLLYMDFGFWDIVPSKEPKGTLNRLIEKKTEDLKGFKSLYSDSFYSEEEFWKIHSKEAFSELKKKYDAPGSFKDLYDKCVRRK